MGWSLGWDFNLKRDVGYGVPAYCDYPGCNEEIDRGLYFVCGSDMYGGEHGCGMHFCDDHLVYCLIEEKCAVQLCDKCLEGDPPFPTKPDHPRWLKHKAYHFSWDRWRKEVLKQKAKQHKDFNYYSRPRNRKRFWELYARGQKEARIP